MDTLKAGTVTVSIAADADEMGREAARVAASELKEKAAQGHDVVLWLMAAPSGFTFYEQFVALAQKDAGLCAVLRKTRFFQFDDYPVGRRSPMFPVTFRHLLETRMYEPLRRACGEIGPVHPLELDGSEKDRDVIAAYRDTLLGVLDDPGAFVVQMKGIGMDGHWGFHGAETPLDAEPDIMMVPMGEQNVHQQMIDCPDYFRTPGDVPKYAVTCNVSLFMKADIIIDLVPQPTKDFAVLATYGTDAVCPEVPSSALKTHPRALAFVTRASARALTEYREGTRKDPRFRLPGPVLERLDRLWDDPVRPDIARTNRERMREVLAHCGFL